MGFSLREIKEIIDRPGFDRRQALLDHRRLLLAQHERLARLIRLADRTLNAMERGFPMNAREMFNGFDPSEYEEEARRRWGGTKEYQESVERTRRYTEEDWGAIHQEAGAIYEGLAALMDRSPSDPEVQKLIRRHHQHINDRFYACSLEVYRGLGDRYAQDERFAAFFDKIRPGLARFMRAAMHAYCDRLEGR